MDYVVIAGEVRYPGKYAINENKDKIADLIRRAGGITEQASAKDIEFVRQKETKKKDLELERLLQIPYNERSLSEQRYTSARSNEKKGAMSIDLMNAISDINSIDNIFLMNQDSIIIPQKIDYINIQGRVQNPGNITYQEGLTYLDYIEIAGGYGYRADESETFIRKTNGEFVFARKQNYILEPGDMILIPSKKEYDFVEGVTTWITILAQFASIAGVIIALSK
jgi:protein involved in polysaccharide export with SLBB domain